MAFQIDRCINEFRSTCRSIEQIGVGTDEIYLEMKQNRLLSESNLKEVELLERHRRMVKQMSERPLIVFIYGQDDKQKVGLINEIADNDEKEIIDLKSIRREHEQAKFVEIGECEDDAEKLKELFDENEIFKHPLLSISTTATMLLALESPSESVFNRFVNNGDKCFCVWTNVIARGSRTVFMLAAHKILTNIPVSLLNEFATVDTGIGFVETLENTLKARAMTSIMPYKESLTGCLCVVLDVLALMSADNRRTHLMLTSAREQEEKLYKKLSGLVKNEQTRVAEAVRTAISTIRVTSKRRFESVSEETTAADIEEFVAHEINAAVTKELLKAADVFKQDYVGTLNRCLNDLCGSYNPNATMSLSRSSAFTTNFTVTQAIASMYHIDLDLMSCMNIFRYYFEKIRYAILNLSSMRSNQSGSTIDPNEIIDTIADSISEQKLVRNLCRKMSTQLEQAHKMFLSSVQQLDSVHSNRLSETEKTQKLLKKEYAPRLALLQLRAMSCISLLNYGKPKMEVELGRGQYGIVYSCSQWGPCSDLALKSVVPVDGRHLRDTALEFYSYTVIPEHPSIIKIYGSVICEYRKNCEQLVIVMERLFTDLHEALKSGLSLRQRYMIAIEVMQGIRHLHRMGLVHRDIKLRNVLLDRNFHAKITDMGFCKPEVLIDGSVVGTPTHMAPELMTAQYDSTVDIYAFGVLLWHLASNSTDLPQNYANFNVPSILWVAVRKGLRPEKPKYISENLWKLVQRCWHVEASMRPSAAEILEELENQYQTLV